MPNSPTGGFSIFLNLIIIFLGFVFKTFKKYGYKSKFFIFIRNRFISKRYNGVWRVITGYAIAIFTFSFLFTVATYSLSLRLKSESNFDHIKDAVESVEYYYTYNYDEKIKKIESSISIDSLKYNILSSNILNNTK